jgi:histidinol dehydrogenase
LGYYREAESRRRAGHTGSTYRENDYLKVISYGQRSTVNDSTMELFKHPPRTDWKNLLKRPSMDVASLETSVANIIAQVRQRGDEAVKQFTLTFDKVDSENFVVSEIELQAAAERVDEELKAAIRQAHANIRKFHAQQLTAPEIVETMPGIKCWRKNVAIDKVGLYIPGGSAPLFSTLLMLAIPATLAGCKEIILCSPPDKSNALHPAILYAAHLLGVHKIYKVGGVQAIAAMAIGTETIAKVNKIFGPGNQYVTCAKMLVQKEGVAIDMPAGPSEVAVYADDTANPAFVAADLLSQAEHGADSQVILVSDSEKFLKAVEAALAVQVDALPRKALALKALEHSKFFLVADQQEALDLLNEYAPEHLILSCRNAEQLADVVTNAGSVFIGNYSPESVGDYASGTNHTLPTNGFASAYSGVSVDSFVKKITFQQLTEEGLQQIGKTVEVMAAAEGLHAHKIAVSLRLEEIRKQGKGNKFTQ